MVCVDGDDSYEVENGSSYENDDVKVFFNNPEVTVTYDDNKDSLVFYVDNEEDIEYEDEDGNLAMITLESEDEGEEL